MLISGLLYAAKIACGIIGARMVGKGLNALGEKIIPYNKTRGYKQAEHSYSNQKEIEKMRETFQLKLQQDNIIAQKELAVFNQMFQRQTSMLLAEYKTHFTLRHTLIQDAIRNFPLNISPLVLLENNNIDVSFLLGETDRNENIETIFDRISCPKPLNVFITPLHIDARVSGKEFIAAQVFDTVYSTVESVFVNEYGRNSERPVAFYSAAWNKNVRGGLHAADELYYFMKDIPTIVVEPRFDGKSVKLMFSCWSIGYNGNIQNRCELPIPLDFNSMLSLSVYERSKKALETLKNVSNEDKDIIEQKKKYEHNVSLFEQLSLDKRIEKRLNEVVKNGSSTELDELGDYSKLLYISSYDVSGISDTIAAVIGMMISALSDTHHLLANDITPKFPYIYIQYFGDFVNQTLLASFGNMYERAYLKLCEDFPEQNSRRLIEKEAVIKLLGISDTKQNSSLDIQYALKQKCLKLGAEEKDCVNWSITELIDFYIENLDDDVKFRKAIIAAGVMTNEQLKKINKKLTKSII